MPAISHRHPTVVDTIGLELGMRNHDKYDKKKQRYDKKKRRKKWIVLCGLAYVFFLIWLDHRNHYEEQILPRPSLPIIVQYKNIDGSDGGKNTTKVIPNVLLVGAQKAGTTSLAEWLFQTRQVCRPQVFHPEPTLPYNKEVHFFDARFGGGIDFYSHRYKHCYTSNDETVLALDATPDYLDQAQRIRSFYDEHVGRNVTDLNLKILIILREPTSRELSLYNHLVNEYLEFKTESESSKPSSSSSWTEMILKDDGQTIMTFDEHVEQHLLPCLKPGYQPRKKSPNTLFSSACYTKKGGYAPLIKEWFNLFDRSQILVLSYDELKNNPNKLLERVSTFLELEFGEGSMRPPLTKENTQSSSNTKVNRPTCIAQEKLVRVFAPWNEDLYSVLETHTGLSIEQQPFPHFQLGNCELRGQREHG